MGGDSDCGNSPRLADARRSQRRRETVLTALLFGCSCAALGLSSSYFTIGYDCGGGADEVVRALSVGGAHDQAAGGGAVALLGIFSTLSDHDTRRRWLIRDTYLISDDRFCPLFEYLRWRDGGGGDDGYGLERGGMERCRAPYVFVVGANPSGPYDHDDWDGDEGSVSSVPLTLSASAVEQLNAGHEAEGDVLYLNIRENMERGKSPSWLKYAASIAARTKNTEHSGGSIDYVAKLDSDTLLHPAPFFDSFLSQLAPHPYNVRLYGPMTRWRPGMPPQQQMKRYGPIDIRAWTDGAAGACGRYYPSGQFYFMSSDLAGYVSSLGSQRREGVRRETGPGWKETEDVDVAGWVGSHPRPVKWIMASSRGLWDHPVKEEEEWVVAWSGVSEEDGRDVKYAGAGDDIPNKHEEGRGYDFCGFWNSIGLLDH